MTQEARSLQFAGAEASPQPSEQAQPAESSTPAGQAQSVGETPSFLTEDGARKLFETMFDSQGQRITAKTENRIRKVLETAQTQGITLTAAQAQSLVETADAAREAQPSQPQQGSATPQQAQPAQQQAQATPSQAAAQPVHPVIAVANEMLTAAGITLEDGDPENSLLDQTTTNPAVFLASIQAAIEAKTKRQAAAGSPARIPALGGSGRPANPVTGITDPNELWKLATRK